MSSRPRRWRSWLSPASRARGLLDVAWVAAFLLLGGWVLVRSADSSVDAGLMLELRPGLQHQALSRRGLRLGSVLTRTERLEQGWRITTTFEIGQAQAARSELQLRRDLSLAGFALEAELERLGDLMGLPALLLDQVPGSRRAAFKAACDLESGLCQVSGELGGRPLTFELNAGRGPVIAAAIYPLLASGRLGAQAEVTVFDPLSLRQRVITYQVQGRETLTLGARRYNAVRVQRDLEGLGTELWLDPQGLVLKEQLPLGFVLEHERFEAVP